MKVSHPKALLFSILIALAISIFFGLLFAVFGDRSVAYAIGTVLFIVGVIAMTMGLLGAVEPSEGWATGIGKRRRQEGRRSLMAKVSNGSEQIEEVTGWALLVWGVVVGGLMIALAFGAFALS